MPETQYIQGNIEDQQGNIILKQGTVSLTAPGETVTAPVTLTDGFYDAWTDKDPSNVYLIFDFPGFKKLQISFSDLMKTNGNVTLDKIDTISVFMILAVLAALHIYARQTGKVSGFTTKDLLPIALIVGGIISFSIIQKILVKLGLWGNAEVSNEITDPKSAFKPGYWQQYNMFTYAITEGQAKEYAKTIYNAFTLFNDDFNAIMGVFGQLKTKANVSFLAWEFSKLYSEDLLTFLTNGGGILPWDGLSTEHLNQVIDYVRKLPTN